MDDRQEVEYIFTSSELAVLLAAVGCKRLIGFSMNGVSSMGQADILRHVHTLFEKDAIENKADGMSLNIAADIRTMLETCKNADRIFRVLRLQPEKSPYAVCYMSAAKTTMVRPCDTMPEGWLVSSTNVEGIVNGLIEAGLIPSGRQDLEDVLEDLPGRSDNSEHIDGEHLIELQQVDVDSGEILNSVQVVRGALNDWMAIAVRNSEVKLLKAYSVKRLMRWIEVGSI